MIVPAQQPALSYDEFHAKERDRGFRTVANPNTVSSPNHGPLKLKRMYIRMTNVSRISAMPVAATSTISGLWSVGVAIRKGAACPEGTGA